MKSPEQQTSPLVSVIVPAYNASRFLDDALASVLAQTYEHLEVVVVDDGSTDDTAALAAAWQRHDGRVRTVGHDRNRGLPAARNTGLRAARGELVNFLDSDDVLHPQKIARQVTAQHATGADIVYSDYLVVDETLTPTGIAITAPVSGDVSTDLPYRNVFSPHSALLRHAIADDAGGFDETLTSAEDWDFWIACARRARAHFHYLPGALCSYRAHGAQMHHNRERMRANQRQVIDKHFRSDPGDLRAARAAMMWAEAKHLRNQGRGAQALALAVWGLATTRSLRRARRVARWGRMG